MIHRATLYLVTLLLLSCGGWSRADTVGNTAVEASTRTLDTCVVGLEIVLPVEAENFSIWAYMGETFDGQLANAWLFDGPDSFTKSSGMSFVQWDGVLDWQQFVLSSGPPTLPAGTYVIFVAAEGSGSGDATIASADYLGSGAGRTSDSGCGASSGAPNYTWSATDVDLQPSIYLEYTEVVPDPPAEGGNGIEGWFLLGALCLAFVVIFGSEA